MAVTGAAGFIGSHIVKILLEEGYRVKACVRDTSDPMRCDFLRAMPAYHTGRLTLHDGDVDKTGVFDEILSDCQGFCHVSHVSDYGNEDYIQEVASNLIASINASDTVCRVIFTSSTAGVGGPNINPRLPNYGTPVVMYEDRYNDEEDPGRIRARKTGAAYSVSKVQSQFLFSEGAAASNGKWDAITLCPSDNVGPILSPHQKDMGPWQVPVTFHTSCKHSQERIVDDYHAVMLLAAQHRTSASWHLPQPVPRFRGLPPLDTR